MSKMVKVERDVGTAYINVKKIKAIYNEEINGKECWSVVLNKELTIILTDDEFQSVKHELGCND